MKIGGVPWSRLLQESIDTILLWRVVLSRVKDQYSVIVKLLDFKDVSISTTPSTPLLYKFKIT